MPSVYLLPMKFKGSQPWWDHPSPAPVGHALCLFLWVFVYVCACSCGFVFTSVWTEGAVAFCQIIPTGVNVPTLFCWTGLVISYTAFSGMTSLSCTRSRISTALCQRDLCSLAVSNTLGLVFWLNCLSFFYSWCSSLSQVPPVIISGFVALENICAHRGCSAGTILWFTFQNAFPCWAWCFREKKNLDQEK